MRIDRKRVRGLLLLMLLAAALVLATGCRTEQTRPATPSVTAARVKAVQQAERERAAAEAREQAAAGERSGAPGATAPGGGGPAAEAASAPPPDYLPPSEDGAYVEITETPADGMARPAARSATGADAAPAGATAAGGGDAGGNMPSGVPTAAPAPGSTSGAGGPRPAAVPGVAGSSAGLPTGAAAAARTREEQLGALDQELSAKLAEFDALMKRAQDSAAAERAARAGSLGAGTGPTGGAGGRLEAPPDGKGAGGAAEVGTGLGTTPDLSGSTTAGQPRRGGAPPVRRPDTRDDDIVARQLREAAEREQDPVLREKLWVEYRKYREGLARR